MAVYPTQRQLTGVLHNFMYKLMKRQIPPEPSTLKLEGIFTKIII